jgi:formate-dependent nitrite reductase cytochrome c552 subunit
MVGVDCIDCHMPRLVKSALGNAANFTGDMRAHLFAINPDQNAAQFDSNGLVSNPYITLDWACNNCHGVTASNQTLSALEATATDYHQ